MSRARAAASLALTVVVDEVRLSCRASVCLVWTGITVDEVAVGGVGLRLDVQPTVTALRNRLVTNGAAVFWALSRLETVLPVTTVVDADPTYIADEFRWIALRGLPMVSTGRFAAG